MARNGLTYPTQTAQGMVWVWPDATASRFLDAHMVDIPPEAPECKKQDGQYTVTQLEIPCDWEIFTENTFDPLHAMATHEGTLPTYLPQDCVDDFRLHTLNVSVDDGIVNQGLTDLAAQPSRLVDMICPSATRFQRRAEPS